MNDKASMVKAMTGASAVYAVTNYWEKMDKDHEIKQGKDLVDAAKETGVQHFIWSSLLNIDKRKWNACVMPVCPVDMLTDSCVLYSEQGGIA
jgi:hypothetical protein